MKTILLILFFCVAILISKSQTSVGIGIYPTGTETGLGFRLNKDNHFTLDARVTKANLYSDTKTSSSFLSEASAIYRLILLEKVRFHIGVGFRGNWNLTTTHKYGPIIPIGVEAFPFPFQNAGLFFEAAPFFETDQKYNWQGGIRTVAGFVFYFPTKEQKTKS
ncbi:MAG: hypothetical protein C0448_14920 [Sphingobacteriaceae bacterium]|nr:hypothetical protein [Sphingobacteriaceae bacterium]